MDNNNFEDKLGGRNAVKEALTSDIEINKILVQKGIHGKGISEIIELCKKNNVIYQTVEKTTMNKYEIENNQGVIALVSPYKYVEVESIVRDDKNSFIVVLDGIQDPHNLGAIIRTAYAAGADGVVIPKRRAVGVTSTVVKASAGAVAHTKIARVTNINQTMDFLKDQGYWVMGADMDGDVTLFNGKFDGKIALVMGSEGSGLSRLVRKNCDAIVSVPMANPIDSLNASVAAALIIYEIYRQRG